MAISHSQQKFSRIGARASRAYLRYEHHISAGFFIGGLIFDVFIFTKIDYLLKNVLLICYFTLSGGSILLSQVLTRKSPQKDDVVLSAFPFIIQFAFGGIISGIFVYFFKSASIIQSWVFLLTIILMLIGNEFFRKRYQRLEFQVSVYFICLYAFTIVLLPYLKAEIGPKIFLQSTAVSLSIISIFLYLLWLANKNALQRSISIIMLSISSVIIILNGLFFARLIPPIPLSLSDAGVFHTFQRNTDGNYSGAKEIPPRYSGFIPFSATFHGSGPIFFYSAISAPTTLNTVIRHEWQHRDEKNGNWVTHTQVRVSIIGGRTEGYRTYSMKDSITPGKWRVNVLTENGQSLGSYTFTVVSDHFTSPLLLVNL